MTQVTYARARLWTGVSGVGFLVVLTTVLLATGAPARALAGIGGDPFSDAGVLALLLSCAALLALPLDVLGGLVLPRAHGRPHPGALAFAAGWLRGVVVLVALSSLSGALLLAAGRAGGRPAALGLFVALCLALLLLQEPLARLVGGLRRAGRVGGVVLVESRDPAFSGGFTGFPARLVLPARWREQFGERALALIVERRRRILGSGAWWRGAGLAVAWNAVGFGLASLLPGAGVEDLGQLATTACGFTLWTFVGLLLLPTPSRRATLAADARMGSDAELLETIRGLDRLQDDEPRRSPGVETVFHPVPSVSVREGALASANGDAARVGAWHLARTALVLSHLGLSLLPRAVHCNVGRPELWVYLPADG